MCHIERCIFKYKIMRQDRSFKILIQFSFLQDIMVVPTHFKTMYSSKFQINILHSTALL